MRQTPGARTHRTEHKECPVHCDHCDHCGLEGHTRDAHDLFDLEGRDA
ncbi:hypothetical protein [Nocardiopsis metallicus]|uniref:Uncharacterized protein n=1 Tax=Nocardiopsis metallicus TaxID=179819 RepID=A0A840W5M9_9ACTN|nr:hypothetical protein [Nocardiopsis metallicus]MBB5491372.1 hypothetical protein [Nocardiopsis metallicus]